MSDELADLASKAKIAFFDGNVDEAHRLFTAAIDRGGRTADNYAGRAQVLNRKGLYKEAFDDAEKALKINSSFAKAFLQKGVALQALGDYELALLVLQLGAVLNPNDNGFVDQICLCEKQIAAVSASKGKDRETVSSANATKAGPDVPAMVPPPSPAPVLEPRQGTSFLVPKDAEIVTISMAEGQAIVEQLEAYALRKRRDVLIIGGYGKMSFLPPRREEGARKIMDVGKVVGGVVRNSSSGDAPTISGCCFYPDGITYSLSFRIGSILAGPKGVHILAMLFSECGPLPNV